MCLALLAECAVERERERERKRERENSEDITVCSKKEKEGDKSCSFIPLTARIWRELSCVLCCLVDHSIRHQWCV